MYVNSRGVTKTNPRRTLSSYAWDEPMGQTSTPQRPKSRLSSLAQSVNSIAAFLLVGALVATAGLAVGVRSKASAQAPASIKNFGKAEALGNPDVDSDDAIVAIASPKKSSGYWVVSAEGQVFPFGNATDQGGIAEGQLNNIVEIASTPSGKGYWLMASDGAVFTFGDAQYLGAPELGKTYVAIITSKSGDGYTLVDDAGQIVTFGDGPDFGHVAYELGDKKITDAVLAANGKGYYMLTKNGEVLAYGDAKHYGDGVIDVTKDAAVALSVTDNGAGYWILSQSGQISSFGSADPLGSSEPTGKKNDAPSVDLAVYNNGDGYWIASGKAGKPKSTVAKTASAKPSGEAAPVKVPTGDLWEALRNCEAGGNYSRNSGNGYYGAYQFSAGTWRSMNTGYEFAHLAPPEVQDDAARRLQARSGWGQWPACSRKIGAR